jgi:hypothetical protein
MSRRIGGKRMCTTVTDRRRPEAARDRGGQRTCLRPSTRSEPATVVMDLESDAFLVVVPSDDD